MVVVNSAEVVGEEVVVIIIESDVCEWVESLEVSGPGVKGVCLCNV